MSRRDEAAHCEDDFFGVRMFWSSYHLERSSAILTDIGFEIVDVSSTAGGWDDEAESAKEDHPLILARKP